MNNNQKDLEGAFYSDGFRLGMKAAESIENKEILFDAISAMYLEIDTLIDSLTEFATTQNQQIDCKKGCEWCCHQPVYAFDYELEYLNDFINRNFNSEEIKKIRQQAMSKSSKLSKLNENELLNSKYPCPLLDNGACSAYAARPMACRIYLSTNLKSCLNFYHYPGKKESIPALLNFTLRAGRMMNEGFKAALKSNGINAEEFRIEEKLMH